MLMLEIALLGALKALNQAASMEKYETQREKALRKRFNWKTEEISDATCAQATSAFGVLLLKCQKNEDGLPIEISFIL